MDELIVERRTFHRRVQQPEENFNNFLVSLRELAKTCNFCSDECNKKNMQDQIIEGLQDVDTIEQLLKEKDLTLDKAINTCRAQEAAKKQRAEISNTPREPVEICALHRCILPSKPAKLYPGCGSGLHEGGRQLTTSHVTPARKQVISLEYVVGGSHHRPPHQSSTHLQHNCLHPAANGLYKTVTILYP